MLCSISANVEEEGLLPLTCINVAHVCKPTSALIRVGL